VTGFLLALAVLQGHGLEASASVDRTELRVGEELMLTVRARALSADPVRITIPPLGGFALVGSRELTEVSIGAGGTRVRTTIRELRLRAEWPGRRVIAAIRVGQGTRVVEVAPLTVQVDSALAGAAAGLSPVARALLDTTPPPDSAQRVTVSVLIPRRPVLAGQQVDLVAAAWFPRDLRLRLRRPPVITLRTPDGVWAYPQAVPGDVAASRLVRGRWLDLFVAHQVVFPLQPGRIAVPPAAVDFALPVTYSFFSREDRYTFQSDSAFLAVVASPEAGRPADDRGVVGADLALEVDVTNADTRAGEPIEVAATITGTGNVALWPEPVLRWPHGFRAYAAQSVARLEPQGGRVAGSKTFEYLVVPDSVGAFVLPDVRYAYYDIGARAYRIARSSPRPIAVAPGIEPRAARALPPLAPPTRPSTADRLAGRLFPWGWLAVLLVPPLLAVMRVRRSAPRQPRAARGPVAPLLALEREFHALLASHVPDPTLRDGDGLAQALRAAGVDGPVAEHVTRLRDRLQAARFGPRKAGDSAELAAELRQVLKFLDGEPARRHSQRARHLPLLLALIVPSSLRAQAPGAEALYEAGALRAAADSFAARAEREPLLPSHWYNLGATLYRAGSDGKAIAAWTRAARLAPRDPLIRRARRLLPPPDAASDALLAVSPATPGEWALLAAVCWVAFWLLVRRRGRVGVSALLGVLFLAAAVPGWMEWRRRARPVAVVLQAGTALRAAPYGSAAALGSLDAGSAIFVARTYGAWLEVRREDGVHGWMLGSELARL
jgi:hypothetical protein